MTRIAARRWLWLAALATMPVPFYLGEVEWAPVMRLAFLTSLLSLVMAAEGGHALIQICTLGIIQTALYTGLFMLAAGLAARAVNRIREPLRVVAVGTIVFLLVASATLPIYETPLSSTRLHSDLWHLFE